MNTSEKGGRRNGKRGRKNKWKIGLKRRKDSRVPGRLLPAGMSSLGPPRGRGGTPGGGGGRAGWNDGNHARLVWVTCLALAGAVKASASSGSRTICPTARLSNVLPIQTSIYKMSTDTFASMYSISFRYKCLNE